jgi:hypothetical protein
VKLLGKSAVSWERLQKTNLHQLVEDVYGKNDLFDAERMENLVHNISVVSKRLMV